MNSIKLKKEKLLKVKIFSILFILFGIVASLESITGIIILFIGVVFIGINFELEIFKNFNNKLNIKFFNLKIYSQNSALVFPEYISIFGQSFSSSNEFSSVSALGSTSGFDYYVICFFDENNRHDFVFKSKKRNEVLEKGKQLAELLNVDLLNKLED